MTIKELKEALSEMPDDDANVYFMTICGDREVIGCLVHEDKGGWVEIVGR